MRFLLTTIFFSFISLQAQAKDFEAGPIWSHDDAKIKCPAVCTAQGSHWTGNWLTTLFGQMSVCACEPVYQSGPIWNQQDAELKCPAVCTSHDQTWDGNWSTTEWGKMSVCQCKDKLSEEDDTPLDEPAPK